MFNGTGVWYGADGHTYQVLIDRLNMYMLLDIRHPYICTNITELNYLSVYTISVKEGVKNILYAALSDFG